MGTVAPPVPHLLVDGSAVGRLQQDFDAGGGELFDVFGGQRRPPLPGVDVLAADRHDGLVVLMAALVGEAARRPPSLEAEESVHDVTARCFETETHSHSAGLEFKHTSLIPARIAEFHV